MGWRSSTLAFCLLIGCARAPTRPSEPPPAADAEAPAETAPVAETPAEPPEPAPPPEPATTTVAEEPGRQSAAKKRTRRSARTRARAPRPKPVAARAARPPAPAAAVAAPSAPAPAATATYSGPDPCELAIRGDSPVSRACHEGGIKKAKLVMKDLVRRAKASGLTLSCDDCHSTQNDYGDLNDDARAKFKKLLEAASR